MQGLFEQITFSGWTYSKEWACEYFALECLETLFLKGVCFCGAFLGISNVEVPCSFQILLSLLSQMTKEHYIAVDVSSDSTTLVSLVFKPRRRKQERTLYAQ